MKLFDEFKRQYLRKLGVSWILILLMTLAQGAVPFVHSVISEENGRVFQYSVVFQEVNIKTNSHITYYWHRNGQLRSTSGDYSGNILHGNSQEFDKSGRMLEKGTYYYGTKDGEWKSWNRKGEIIKLEKWKRGFLKKRISYDLTRRTIENFKQNKLDGRRIVLNNELKESVEHYRNGVRINKDKKTLKSLIHHKKHKKEPDVVNDKEVVAPES